jgi:prevent-host-death family protein
MSQIDVDAAAKDLHGLIARARDGEEVVIVEDGQEVAKLVPVAVSGELPPRRLGLAEGKWAVPDDFDAPLPDDVLALFYEGPLFPPESPSRDEK